MVFSDILYLENSCLRLQTLHILHTSFFIKEPVSNSTWIVLGLSSLQTCIITIKWSFLKILKYPPNLKSIAKIELENKKREKLSENKFPTMENTIKMQIAKFLAI